LRKDKQNYVVLCKDISSKNNKCEILLLDCMGKSYSVDLQQGLGGLKIDVRLLYQKGLENGIPYTAVSIDSAANPLVSALVGFQADGGDDSEVIRNPEKVVVRIEMAKGAIPDGSEFTIRGRTDFSEDSITDFNKPGSVRQHVTLHL
jgi:hypothetical protein